ncbi:hypothetical protein CORMATOL_02383 [Corynebacterium matruchotii ATCC 33806]|uniref:Uncharacterized protein n=1 Tax=Corynebacterium matruchotii ATCC 33806 TaxID=566549 RepID=C0E5V2_9CORY|nr:hypothetical protein CORMATOL_02383 [Corynebacterium matruchotii ATCC 33806]
MQAIVSWLLLSCFSTFLLVESLFIIMTPKEPSNAVQHSPQASRTCAINVGDI